jgi:DNA-binding NarL/FixJ family response regulator
MNRNFELTTFNNPFIRVAIVDDHKVVADGFERIVNESEQARVIGKAYSAEGCLALLETACPDVLLLDVGLPDLNGISLCSTIKEKYPHVNVLMLTSYGELFTINRALDAGVGGYMLKSASTEEVIEGIAVVASGGRYLCDEAKATITSVERKQLEFTRREMELLQLIADGLSLQEQADRMCLGQNTIRSYRQQLNIKLDVHNTAQLIQTAKNLKLV